MTSNQKKSAIDRRDFMRATGVASTAGIATLAGCTGDDSEDGADDNDGNGNGNNGSGTGNGAEPADSVIDREHTRFMWLVPSDVQYNPHNFQNQDREPPLILFDPLARYDTVNDEYRPVLAEDWSFDLTEATVELRDDFTWHNGDDVLAKDLEIQMRIGEYMDEPIWNYLESVEATDEYTVEFTFEHEVSPLISQQQILETRLNQPRALYEEHLEALDDADNEEDAVGDVRSWSLEEPIGNGPFQFEEATQQELVLERFEEYPMADEINFSTIALPLMQEPQNQYAALQNDELDGTTDIFVPPELQDQIDDPTVTVTSPNYGEMAFDFNHTHEIWGRRKVRQAFAHIVDNQAVSMSAGGQLMDPVEYQTGLSPYVFDEWLGGIQDQLETYDNLERAAELLEEEGFSQEGDVWYTPDGDEFSVTIRNFSGTATWGNGGQTAIDTLIDFGIDAVFMEEDPTTLNERIVDSDFEIVTGAWGSWWEPVPYFAFEEHLTGVGPRDHLGISEEVTIPSFENPDEEATYNIDELLSDLQRAETDEDATEATEKLAWVWNQYLPKYQCFDRDSQSYMNTDGWVFPDIDDPIMDIKFAANYLLREGKLKAAE